MPQFKPNAIQSILYYLHHQGHSVDSALTEIQNLTETQEISRDDVEKFFEKIQKGEWNIRMEERKQTENKMKLDDSPISRMPHLIYEQILEKLDLESRLKLSQTSHLFRNIVNTTRTNMKKFTFVYSLKYVQFSIDDDFCVKLENVRDGCIVRNKVKDTFWLIKNEKFNDLAEILFNSIMSQENLRIEEFRILEHDMTTKNYEEIDGLEEYVHILNNTSGPIIHSISSVLQSRETQLKVMKFSAKCLWCGILDELLPTFDPNILKSIKYEDNCDDTEVAFYDYPQFKNVTSFSCDSTEIVNELDGFLEFNNCDIRVKLASDTVLGVMEELLQNPNLQQWKAKHDHYKDEELKDIKEALGIPTDITDIVWKHFDYPNGNEKKLSVCVTTNEIWFKGPKYLEEEKDKEDDNTAFELENYKEYPIWWEETD
ncbi:hypothetical protein GCK72_009214 [Caenorhabditis remanei]|uniref:F-box domain-containing protein n=1 Tax=Caenorhabditis remanei TaxID=31234 RepID=A0A6A5H1R8_CAERE|nr:hypothetical protein GCK72_009214 [Caenorhabditis remanei]KAF1760961.1 hypothetical protein GCK72_009214 [Caenorhabditis remanei]